METIKQIAEKTGRTQQDVNAFINKHYPEMTSRKGQKRYFTKEVAAKIIDEIKTTLPAKRKNRKYALLKAKGFDPICLSDIAVQYKTESTDAAEIMLNANEVYPISENRGKGNPVIYDRKQVERILLMKDLPAPELNLKIKVEKTEANEVQKKMEKSFEERTAEMTETDWRFARIRNLCWLVKYQIELAQMELKECSSEYQRLAAAKQDLKEIYIEADDGKDEVKVW